MPEPFKNLFNEKAIRAMAGHLVRTAPKFDGQGFIDFAVGGLDDLELKERSSRITDALERFLPGDFIQATKILVASLEPATGLSIGEMEQGSTAAGIRGWPVMPMADYVARHGQDHLMLSLEALKEMTKRSTSEMAIRPFIKNHETAVLQALAAWTGDENVHVRRLVSEGTRPRLPWATHLPRFIENPAPILPLLEQLKDDDEDYVRRSVANNLNDIAKDHPDLVAGIAQDWMKGATPERKKLVRHALRTLIKSGHHGALKALGYGPPEIKLSRFEVLTDEVRLGGELKFEAEIASSAEADQALIIDYVVHHMRANGETTPKVFKWKTATLKPGGVLRSDRRHPIRPITTRRYYAGHHKVEILINGQNFGGQTFLLLTE